MCKGGDSICFWDSSVNLRSYDKEEFLFRHQILMFVVVIGMLLCVTYAYVSSKLTLISKAKFRRLYGGNDGI